MSARLATPGEMKANHRWKKMQWRPGSGMDQRLRQFYCQDCGLHIYRRIGDKEREKELAEREA